MANRLQHETSPYLLQHAHNPVDWYPWGPEAFERARREDKPVLLSVGYSACHWCHVMERESFENPAIAAQMNRLFVCIKVDREERPDVDSIYMSAVQAMSGHGGWPMTVFLTPDGKPFYGGTYYPPVDGRGMPGFPRVLDALADAYRTRRDDIVKSADELTAAVAESQQLGGRSDDLTPALLDVAYQHILPNFDRTAGGFSGAPKFPQPMILEFLLRTHARTDDRQPLAMTELTLHKMAEGGMYDQIGGGFHRYSTDAEWLVPHFEKMLYDNAQLVPVYLHAWQITGGPFYRRIVEETLDYIVREMTAPDGGFYATQDADSEGEEGKFFVWTPAEVRAVLGDRAGAFMRAYDITDRGNFEGQNIPHLVEGEAEAFIAERQALFAVRERRVHPGRDDKILTGWNGMMLRAFSEAAAILDRDDYRRIAERNATFLLTTMRAEGRLLRTSKDGRAHIAGFLEDHAQLADGLVSLYELTFDRRWLDEAAALTDDLISRFWDADLAGFYDTAHDADALIVRPRDTLDNATPSGSSVAIDVLLRLAVILDRRDFEEIAAAALRSMGQLASRAPQAFGRLLSALDRYLTPGREVAILGDGAGAMLAEARRRYAPNQTIAASTEPSDLPILAGKTALGGPTAYVCQRYVCQAPTTDLPELARQLDQR